MKHLGLSFVVLTALFSQSFSVFAETSLDVLEKDLNQVKQDHASASSQAVKGMMSQLDAASASPDAALALYQQAGGLMPVARPQLPLTQGYQANQEETADQKAARLAKDQDESALLAMDLQAHCGLMRFGVSFAINTDQKGLHDEWIAWLKAVGPSYPQLKGTGFMRAKRPAAAANSTGSAESTDTAGSTNSPDSNADTGGNGGNRRRRLQQQQDNGGGGAGGAGGGYEPIGDWKTINMGESIIGKFFGFHGWEGKDQQEWAINDIPKFYRTDILDPLRTTPTADTLAAWDVYIAMKNADQVDSNQWSQVDYPSLAFDRASDDYLMKPGMEKLQAMIAIIKAVPTHPKLDDMISRLHGYVEDYRTNHGGVPAQTSAVATTSGSTLPPNVTVQTTNEGDMTIITTHTNAPPVSPTPNQ